MLPAYGSGSLGLPAADQTRRHGESRVVRGDARIGRKRAVGSERADAGAHIRRDRRQRLDALYRDQGTRRDLAEPVLQH